MQEIWNFVVMTDGTDVAVNRLTLPFSTIEGSAGLMTIDNRFIHIRYIAQHQTSVP